jgi:hypothetical protein
LASRTMLEASVLAVSGPYFLANRTSLVIVMNLTVERGQRVDDAALGQIIDIFGQR